MAGKLKAQQNVYDSVNRRHDKISLSAMYVLAGWSLASLTAGIVGQNNSEGEVKQFHHRNILWGSLNLGLSGLSFLRLKMSENKTYTAAETFKRVNATQKAFLFNAGLDLAYVAFGLYTRERAFRFTGNQYDKLRGTGNSLLMQGSFLALFDGILYVLHTKNVKRLEGKLQMLSFAATQDGFGLVYHF